jgi:hypothetical protein
MLTPWIIGRPKPRDVYGRMGLKAMTKDVMKAWEVDTACRAYGKDLELRHAIKPLPCGFRWWRPQLLLAIVKRARRRAPCSVTGSTGLTQRRHS